MLNYHFWQVLRFEKTGRLINASDASDHLED